MDNLIRTNIIKQILQTQIVMDVSPSITNVAHQIKKALDEVDKIYKARMLHAQELEQLEKDYIWAVASSKSRWTIIRENCKHQSTKYYPDASGNNDSCTICDICGEEISS